MPMSEKQVCSRCGVIKPLDEFQRDTRYPAPRRRAACKMCLSGKRREWYWQNPEQVREKMRSYRAQNPESVREWKRRHYETHKDHVKAQVERWRKANPGRRNETQQERYRKNPARYLEAGRRWREANPEKCAEMSRRWKQANPEKVRALQSRRRARIRGNGAVIYDHQAIYERDSGICHICRRKVSRKNFTLDHLIPIVHGGPDVPENVAVAHRLCNERRGAGWLPAQLRLVG